MTYLCIYRNQKCSGFVIQNLLFVDVFLLILNVFIPFQQSTKSHFDTFVMFILYFVFLFYCIIFIVPQLSHFLDQRLKVWVFLEMSQFLNEYLEEVSLNFPKLAAKKEKC